MDQIFHCTLDENFFITRTTCKLPLVLAMICKDWRDIALSLPQLWSSVNIIIKSDELMFPQLPLVRQWLERSRSSPLSFNIYNDTIGEKPSTLLVSILRLYISHIHRWRSVGLLADHLPDDFLEEMASLNAPLLENIYLRLYQLQHGQNLNKLSNFVASAFRLHRWWSSFHDMPFKLPWSQQDK